MLRSFLSTHDLTVDGGGRGLFDLTAEVKARSCEGLQPRLLTGRAWR